MPNTYRLKHTVARIAVQPVRTLIRPLPRLNRALWDLQYSMGAWRYLDEATDGALPLEILAEHLDLPHARILDLGCGTSANLPLRPGGYGHYHGVDISRKAIAAARRLGRPHTTFEAADIQTYDTTERYDAVLLRQVLYYFPMDKISDLMNRFAGFLRPGGLVVAQIYDAAAAAPLIQAIHASGLRIVVEHPEPHPGQPEGVLFALSAD